jgi:hypothetical protein
MIRRSSPDAVVAIAVATAEVSEEVIVFMDSLLWPSKALAAEGR